MSSQVLAKLKPLILWSFLWNGWLSSHGSYGQVTDACHLREKGQLCALPPQRRAGHFCFGLQLLSKARGSGLQGVVVGTEARYREVCWNAMKTGNQDETLWTEAASRWRLARRDFLSLSWHRLGLLHRRDFWMSWKRWAGQGISGCPKRRGHAKAGELSF